MGSRIWSCSLATEGVMPGGTLWQHRSTKVMVGHFELEAGHGQPGQVRLRLVGLSWGKLGPIRGKLIPGQGNTGMSSPILNWTSSVTQIESSSLTNYQPADCLPPSNQLYNCEHIIQIQNGMQSPRSEGSMGCHQLIAQLQAGHSTIYKQVACETLTNKRSSN